MQETPLVCTHRCNVSGLLIYLECDRDFVRGQFSSSPGVRATQRHGNVKATPRYICDYEEGEIQAFG